MTLKEYLRLLDGSVEKVHISCVETTIEINVENDLIYEGYFAENMLKAKVTGIGVNDYGVSFVTVEY